jgi:succinate-semialdehyde dehydrogenase/glutarate-semialdehyde dehydrogenase
MSNFPDVTEFIKNNSSIVINNVKIKELTNELISVINPATEEIIANVPQANQSHVLAAIEASTKSKVTWEKISAWERSKILREISKIMREEVELFATVMTLEQGKPIEQSKAEVLAAADQFDWNADEARRIYGRLVSSKSGIDEILIYKQPVGIVALFAPWNFPSLLPARKISAALAAGCTVIAVAPIEAPLSCLLIADAAIRAGLPAGVLNVLTGNPEYLSKKLIDANEIRKVSITSSVPVGAKILERAAKKIKPVTVELGGHSAVLVLKDANVEEAARLCAVGKFRNAGQVCISANRFFVEESIAEKFIEIFLHHSKQIRIGDGLSLETDMGPLGTKKRLVAMQNIVEDAVGKGAEIALGGKAADQFESGYFFEPTVLLKVRENMEVMREETFGPLAPIATYKNLESAIAMANSTPYGLAGFIFTQDLNLAIEVGKKLEVGMVGINNLTIATAEAPFGGVRESGFGREGGIEGIEDYLITKYMNARMAKVLK